MQDYSIIPWTARINKTLDNNTPSDIIQIYKVGQGNKILHNLNKDNYEGITLQSHLKGLDAVTFCYSLPEAPLPNINAEDTSEEIRFKLLRFENESPRIQLNLWIRTPGEQWAKIASVNVINPGGFEWRSHTLLDFLTPNISAELGEKDIIGISLEDMGWGLLDTGDRITISGFYTEEICLIHKNQDSITNINIDNNISGGGTTDGGTTDGGTTTQINYLSASIPRILSKDAAWVWQWYANTIAIGTNGNETATGSLAIGDFTPNGLLHLWVAGGFLNNPGSKIINTIRSSDNTILESYSSTGIHGNNAAGFVRFSIDTSAYGTEPFYIQFRDLDTGTSWAWFVVSLNFSWEQITP